MVDKTTDNKLCILSIYKPNYLTQYHIRQMANLMKKSHVTLLPHLKALEKDAILTQKTIGKNKAYSLNLDNINAKIALLVAEAAESMAYLNKVFIIKSITAEIAKLNLSGTVILFGSYAKQTFKEESDIDLFYFGDIMDEEWKKISNFGKIYGKNINIKKASKIAFENGLRAKDPLIEEVVKSHILLHNMESFVNSLWRYYNEIRRQ